MAPKIGKYRVVVMKNAHTTKTPHDEVYHLFSYLLLMANGSVESKWEVLGVFEKAEHAWHIAWCLAMLDLDEERTNASVAESTRDAGLGS